MSLVSSEIEADVASIYNRTTQNAPAAEAITIRPKHCQERSEGAGPTAAKKKKNEKGACRGNRGTCRGQRGACLLCDLLWLSSIQLSYIYGNVNRCLLDAPSLSVFLASGKLSWMETCCVVASSVGKIFVATSRAHQFEYSNLNIQIWKWVGPLGGWRVLRWRRWNGTKIKQCYKCRQSTQY